MLIFLYFHPIIGPDILLTAPTNLLENINPEWIEEIKNYFDTAEPGFFTHSSSGGDLRTVNYFFTAKSEWARGREEMCMITKILQEADPNLEAYESEFIKFGSRIKKEIQDFYQVLYIRNPPEGYRDEIHGKLEELKEYFSDIYNEISMIKIRTFGNLIPVNFFNEQKILHIPARFIKDLSSHLATTDNKNVFTVYQFRDGRIKIEMIPVKCTSVLKITIFFSGALSPEALKEIGLIFVKYKLPLIYTSGICSSERGKCIYEVYLDSTYAPNRKILFKELMNIEQVEEVKILLIG